MCERGPLILIKMWRWDAIRGTSCLPRRMDIKRGGGVAGVFLEAEVFRMS